MKKQKQNGKAARVPGLKGIPKGSRLVWVGLERAEIKLIRVALALLTEWDEMPQCQARAEKLRESLPS